MKKAFLAVLVASATAAKAATTSREPAGFPESFPVENVYPESVFPVFPGGYPVFPQEAVFPEPETAWPIAATPFPAS